MSPKIGARNVMAILAALWSGLAAVAIPATAARADDGQPIVLFPYVWEAFQEYLGLQRPGVFAVSRDGSVYGYSYCPEIRCVFHTGKKIAVESCEKNGGVECVVFASERDIRIAYRVIDLAVAGACPSSPVPQVTIVADMPAPVYDYSHDVESLTAFERLGRATPGSVHFELLGLTVHDFDSWIEADLRPSIRENEGLVCAGFEDSEIRLQMRSNIYVANDFPKDSCLYREVLAHEERHHEVARRLFAEFAADATQRLAGDLRARPFLQVSDPWEGRSASQARAQQAIDAAYIEFSRRYDTEQAAIDTTEEYTRIANACPDAEEYVD